MDQKVPYSVQLLEISDFTRLIECLSIPDKTGHKKTSPERIHQNYSGIIPLEIVVSIENNILPFLTLTINFDIRFLSESYIALLA